MSERLVGERQRSTVKSSGAASDVSDGLGGADWCFGGMRCVRSASDSRRSSSSAETSKGQRQMAERADAGAAAFACINVFLSVLIDHLYGMVEIPHQHPCSSVTAAAKCKTGLATGLIDQAMLSGCRYGLDCWRELSDH